jgi:S-adenosylmethionine synthetase
MRRLFTSESVTEGHPDKVADQISDAILDAVLAQDPNGRVAVETFLTGNRVILGGEITTTATINYEQIARQVIAHIGYDHKDKGLDHNTCEIQVLIGQQSPDIADSVDTSLEARTNDTSDNYDAQGAGDQGLMFGYATNETTSLMPAAIHLAHTLAQRLAAIRKNGTLPYLRPDGKTQVTIAYEEDKPVAIDTIVISTQHDDHIELTQLQADILEHLITPVLEQHPELDHTATNILINPSGRFVIGGPTGDAGLTGRKIIVDTYGGAARHGGGAFSGKDPSKVDRSAAYAMRWVAKNVVAAGLAERCEVQIAYAIGVAHPIAVYVNTYGTGVKPDTHLAEDIKAVFDLRPAAIIHSLRLTNPDMVKYQETAAYGHFGATAANTYIPFWESTMSAEQLKLVALGLPGKK